MWIDYPSEAVMNISLTINNRVISENLQTDYVCFFARLFSLCLGMDFVASC